MSAVRLLAVCPRWSARLATPARLHPPIPGHRRLRYVSGDPSVRPSDLMSVYQLVGPPWPLCPIAPLALAPA
jgi:hypothetical protein